MSELTPEAVKKKINRIVHRPAKKAPPKVTYIVDPASDHLHDHYGPYDDPAWRDD